MYKKDVTFEYPICGKGRPQVILIGNGLERCMGQYSWEDLLNNLQHPSSLIVPLLKQDAREQNEQKRIITRVPFPLRYELYCSDGRDGIPQSKQNAEAEYKRFFNAIKRLSNEPNILLQQMTTLGADHIFTTNYSYSLENSFGFLDADKKKIAPCSRELSAHRLYLSSIKEVRYRLHTCYAFGHTDTHPPLGVWHIHGETSVPKGIVLGHDGYGRMLGKITEECRKTGNWALVEQNKHSFTSWPELFLFADIYVLGFSFDLSEFDLWWLLKRKQQERRSDGQIYFYE